MAREAYRSLYGDLAKLKDRSLLDDPAGGTDFDDELWELLLASSDWVDNYCNRHFYPRVQTLELDGPTPGMDTTEMLIPDLISLTTLKADENEDLTFEVTWATTDFWLLPYNAEPTELWGRAYTRIGTRAKGAKTAFLSGERIYEFAGVWGFRQFEEASGSLIDQGAGYTSSATVIVVDNGTDFSIGQTIYIATEALLITAISGNGLTVVRGMNGTTAASISDDDAVNILRIPPSVERACLMNVARIWVRGPSFEPAFVDSDVDTDIRNLLDPYRRLVV